MMCKACGGGKYKKKMKPMRSVRRKTRGMKRLMKRRAGMY